MGITNKRIQKVKAYLESINLDGMYVTNLTNVRYLTGFTGSAGSVLILQDTQHFFTDGRYIEQSKNQVTNCKIHIASGAHYMDINKKGDGLLTTTDPEGDDLLSQIVSWPRPSFLRAVVSPLPGEPISRKLIVLHAVEAPLPGETSRPRPAHHASAPGRLAATHPATSLGSLLPTKRPRVQATPPPGDHARAVEPPRSHA